MGVPLGLAKRPCHPGPKPFCRLAYSRGLRPRKARDQRRIATAGRCGHNSGVKSCASSSVPLQRNVLMNTKQILAAALLALAALAPVAAAAKLPVKTIKFEERKPTYEIELNYPRTGQK